MARPETIIDVSEWVSNVCSNNHKDRKHISVVITVKGIKIFFFVLVSNFYFYKGLFNWSKVLLFIHPSSSFSIAYSNLGSWWGTHMVGKYTKHPNWSSIWCRLQIHPYAHSDTESFQYFQLSWLHVIGLWAKTREGPLRQTSHRQLYALIEFGNFSCVRRQW